MHAQHTYSKIMHILLVINNVWYLTSFQIFLDYLVCLFSGEVEMAHISLVVVREYVLEVKVYTLHTCMKYKR